MRELTHSVHRLARSCSSREEHGLSLVEILVATAVASVIIAASLGWLLSVMKTARFVDDRCQAVTAATAALRVLSADLESATALSAPDGGYASGCAVRIHRAAVDAVSEPILVVWDQQRRVLWQKTSSTYLADHVTAFSLTCYGSNGEEVVLSSTSQGAPCTSIRRVSILLSVAYGSAEVSLRRDIPLVAS